MNIRFPTIFFFRIQRCNSFPFQPRSHLGPLISSLGCFSKFPKIPTLSYTPNMALFSFQRSTTLGGGRVSLTCNNPGTPSGAHAPRRAPPRRGASVCGPESWSARRVEGLASSLLTASQNWASRKFILSFPWLSLNCEGAEYPDRGTQSFLSLCLTAILSCRCFYYPYFTREGIRDSEWSDLLDITKQRKWRNLD